jgi:hypothetical protein
MAILVSMLIAVLSRSLFVTPFRSWKAVWNECRPRTTLDSQRLGSLDGERKAYDFKGR